MIPLLAPLFQGDLASQGNRLAHTNVLPAEAILLTTYLHNPSHLEALLHRYAHHLGHKGSDLRAVASSWSLGYLSALLPPVCAAATLLHHVFPIDANQISVLLEPSGLPRSFHITMSGNTHPGAPTLIRYESLLWKHLTPLFEAIAHITRLPQKILWGNTARRLENVFLRAADMAQPLQHQITLDYDALLEQPQWYIPTVSDETTIQNPMLVQRRTISIIRDGLPTSFPLHRQCCLYYKLPKQEHCAACPLHPQYKKI